MNLFLQGADIHDVLTCLGRHVVANVSFGFSNTQEEELHNNDIIFVEDTDQQASCVEGCHKGKNDKKETNFDWSADQGEPTEKDRNIGWGMDEGETMQKVDNGGWGMDEGETMQKADNGGWGTGDKQGVQNTDNGGWGTSHEQGLQNEDNDNLAWGSGDGERKKKKVDEDHAGWGSGDKDSQKNEVSAKWGIQQGKCAHTVGDTGWGMDESKEGVNRKPSSNTDWGIADEPARGGWNGNTGGDSAVVEDDAFMKAPDQIHRSRRSIDVADAAEDDGGNKRRSGNFGPSGTNTVPLGKRRNTMRAGPSNFMETTLQVETGCDVGVRVEVHSLPGGHAEVGLDGGQKNDDAWGKSIGEQGDKHKQTGWCNDHGWDSTAMVEIKEKNSCDVSDCWGGTEGPSDGAAVKRPYRMSMNLSDATERQCDDEERRSGKFAPSGSNMVPLGKRKNAINSSDVVNTTNEKQGEEDNDQRGWGSTEQPAMADDEGWSQVDREDEGQGGVKPDIAEGPRSYGTQTPSQPVWGSDSSFVPFTNQSSQGPPGQDRPSRKFNNQGFFNNKNPWSGQASPSPQISRKRRRLKALLHLPEYAEVDEIAKVANRILHHKGYQPGDKLNAEDERFVLEKVLEHHPDKETKLGCGMDYIMTDDHSDHQVSCFWIVRKDESKTDFSYWKCLEALFEAKYPGVSLTEWPDLGGRNAPKQEPRNVVVEDPWMTDSKPGGQAYGPWMTGSNLQGPSREATEGEVQDPQMIDSTTQEEADDGWIRSTPHYISMEAKGEVQDPWMMPSRPKEQAGGCLIGSMPPDVSMKDPKGDIEDLHMPQDPSWKDANKDIEDHRMECQRKKSKPQDVSQEVAEGELGDFWMVDSDCQDSPRIMGFEPEEEAPVTLGMQEVVTNKE